MLVHLVDAYQEDIGATYQVIRDELKAYKVDLSAKPEIIAINKVDGLDDEIIADQMKLLKKTRRQRRSDLYHIGQQRQESKRVALCHWWCSSADS